MEPVCVVCLDSDPPPIQSGCACRSDSGLAHVDCLVEKAVTQEAHRGIKVWWECQTCQQSFTGAMRTGLGEAWCSRVRDQAEESEERLSAAGNLADCRQHEGQYAEAERINRHVLSVEKRVLGETHPHTLATESNLALSLSLQEKHAEAERINREVLGARRRVLGEEHLDTLGSAGNLGSSLQSQGKHAEAEQIGEEHPLTLGTAGNLALLLSLQGKQAEAERLEREVYGVMRRVLGEEHPSTLKSAINLANSLSGQERYAEAAQIQRVVLGVSRRVLGKEHPDTLGTAGNLAHALHCLGKHTEAERVVRELLDASRRVFGTDHPGTLTAASNLAGTLLMQGKCAEAERILQDVFVTQQRVLGASNPDTLRTAHDLACVRLQMRTELPCQADGKTGAPTARAVKRCLPAGTRVLVQRLVAKPEYNGLHARVLSFDARGGRYAVALDDGKELSLKPECVARAGCASVGCASEEASSVCARCHAVRYCSSECQRADWKAHRPSCSGAAEEEQAAAAKEGEGLRKGRGS